MQNIRFFEHSREEVEVGDAEEEEPEKVEVEEEFKADESLQ